MKILVCEDEQVAHQWLKRLLEKLGHEVISAYTGAESVQIAEEQEPELIFLDMLFPDTDGVTVLQKLRSNHKSMAVPIVATSATEPDKVRPRVESFDLQDILHKPLRAPQVEAALKQAAEKEDAAEQPGGVIMIIEESDVQRKILGRFVEDFDYRPVFPDGTDAASKLINIMRPLAIITSTNESIEAIQRLVKSARAEKQIPVIAISSIKDRNYIQQLYRTGVDDIILKPINLARLRKAIDELLNRGKEKTAPQASANGEKTILLIEDFTIAAKALESMVRSQGFDLIAARSGEAALDLIQNHSPDLILLDINLPGMNGIEFVEHLKERNQLFPFAVITGSRDVQQHRKLSMLGAQKLFHKPVDRDDLLSFIKGFLRPDDHGGSDAAAFQVLLAVDDRAACEIIGSALREDRISHKLVTNGYQALAEMENHPPVAIVDAALSGLKGTEVMKRFSERRVRSRVVALVEQLNDAVTAELTELGAAAIMSKPFDLQKLLDTVRSLLAESENPVSLEEFKEEFLKELDAIPAPDHSDFIAQARRLGHNLAGTAGLIGDRALSELGITLENAAEAGDAGKCRTHLEEVRKHLSGTPEDAGEAQDEAEQPPEEEKPEAPEEETP